MEICASSVGRGNLVEGRVGVKRLLHCVRNDRRALRDCFVILFLAMTFKGRLPMTIKKRHFIPYDNREKKVQ